MEAANEAVQRGDYKTRYGNFAYVAAITENAMIQATTPEDPKAIEAARFIFNQTGLGDEEGIEDRENTSIFAQLGRETVMLLLERAKAIRGE